MDAPARAAVFEPVAPLTTYEETVGRLGRAIRIGVLAPGSRLPSERELATRLGISRSTLRQALATLTETGHLTATRGRTGGTFVAQTPPVSSGTVAGDGKWRELVDWRFGLEIAAVHLAAERAGEAELERLAGILERMTAALEGEWIAYRRADAAFHLAIAEASGSPRLVAAATASQSEMTDLFEGIPHSTQALQHSHDQHGPILEALRAGDPAGAVACMREHLDGLRLLIEGLQP